MTRALPTNPEDLASLLALLTRAKSAGVHLRVDGPRSIVSPRSNLTRELLADLRKRSVELNALLRWDRDKALRLAAVCLAHAAERYSGGDDLSALCEPGNAIDDAIDREDMFDLWLAVRLYFAKTEQLFESRKGAT